MKCNRLKIVFSNLCFLLFFQLSAQDTITLESIARIESPIVENKRITYSIDLVFSSYPDEYWAFYDSKTKKLIIEFYNILISSQQPLLIQGVSIVRHPAVTNIDTKMALSGKCSQVSFSFDESWHFEVGSFSKKILRLKLWKDLDPVKVIEEKKLPVIMRVLIPTLCAGIALIISSVVISNVN